MTASGILTAMAVSPTELAPTEPAATEPAPTLMERRRQSALEEIVDVALDLFVRNGFEATTVESIALPTALPARAGSGSTKAKRIKRTRKVVNHLGIVQECGIRSVNTSSGDSPGPGGGPSGGGNRWTTPAGTAAWWLCCTPTAAKPPC